MHPLDVLSRILRTPPREFAAKTRYYGRRMVRRRLDRRLAHQPSPDLLATLRDSLSGKTSVDDYVASFHRRELPRWFGGMDDPQATLTAWQTADPGALDGVVVAATSITQGTYELLGSGPTQIGVVPDWHVDFKSGFRWPVALYTHLHLVDPDNDADVKVPWDLSRALHWVALGLAWRYTRKACYVETFIAQLADWLEANPWLRGVQWATAMEVAVRAANWLWAYYLFSDADAFTPELRAQMLGALILHGRFLRCEHDYLGGYTTNHHLANLAGLVYLGLMMPEVREARSWLRFGRENLAREIMRQSYPDGVIHEASTSYHGLSLEILLWTTALMQRNGYAWPDKALERLAAMVRFTAALIRDDGSVPLIGDADNGHWHLFRWPDPVREKLDHRHLLSLGEVALGQQCAPCLCVEPQVAAALWAQGPDHKVVEKVERPPNAFPEAGFYVLRSETTHVVVDNGPHKPGGGHGHNDTLSFELYAYGRVMVRDPGSYVYTADGQARNRFRGTAMHNTVMVDGIEQNELPADLFRLAVDVTPTVQTWQDEPAQALLKASHDGYHRLADPVTHRRAFKFDKEAGWLRITDELEGPGRHDLASSLHLDAGLQVTPLPDQAGFLAQDEIGRGLLILATGMAFRHEAGQIAPSYGVLKEAPVLVARLTQAALPITLHVLLWPFEKPPPPLEQALTILRTR